MNARTQRTDLLHRDRGAPAVTATALNQHHPAGLIQRPVEGIQVHRTGVGQRQFVVSDTELGQRALPLLPQTDDLLEGVVGTTGDREQSIARPKHTEQGCSDGMGAADELQPHSRRLSAEHTGKNAVDDLTALVPMAIASQRSEMLRAQSFSSHRLQHPLKALFDRCCSALNDPAKVVGDRIHQIPGLVAAPLIHPQGQSIPTPPCCAVVRVWSAHCRQTTPLDFCH